MSSERGQRIRATAVSGLSKLGIVLVTLLLTLALLEIITRLLHLGTGGFWEPYALYGWRNIPNADGWESCYGECAVHVRINSQGLRDREIPYAKATGQQRILFLGDSITAGMQVPLEMTFAKQLETSLQQAQTAGQWEIVNASVNGFGTDNELLFYRLEAHKYTPDVVILSVYLANDIYNNSRVLELRTGGQAHKPYFTLDEDGRLQLQNFPVPNTDTFTVRVGTYLKKHFQLPRFVAQVLDLRRQVPGFLNPVVELLSGKRGVPESTPTPINTAGETGTTTTPAEVVTAVDDAASPPTICDADYAPEIAAAWDITRAIIRQLRQEVEANGAKLAVILIPAAPQIVPPTGDGAWYCERPNLEMTNFLAAEGVPYLDLLYPFREHILAGGERLYYQRDFHLNEAGHTLAARELFPFVTSLETSR